MRPKYISVIAEYLDVDPRLLTGEIVSWDYDTQNDLWQYSFSAMLNRIEDYPFIREKMEKIQRQKTEEYITNLLGVFSISYTQFKQLSEEAHYIFLHELFGSIETVILKTFDQDCYGDKSMIMCHWPIEQLESAHDDYLLSMSIKEEYVRKPPKGFSAEDIRKMTSWELIKFDYNNSESLEGNERI